MEFTKTNTCQNLMRAFAGESMARNRYEMAAATAKKQGHEALAKVFQYTANQEKEHAEVFYDLLLKMAGTNVEICAGYPVDVYEDLGKALEAAHHNEMEEYEDAYANFGEEAEREGYAEVAAKFRSIAKIELSHAERFQRLLQMYREGTLYQAEAADQLWICTNCGHLHVGPKAPIQCPVCNEGQGYFVRSEENCSFVQVS